MPTPDTTIPGSHRPKPAPSHVLLVEDDSLVRDLYTNMLGRLGHQVIVAVDGEQALEVFLKDNGNIGWVMIDVMLPGMSGPSLLEDMRRERPDLPAVVVSGRADYDTGFVPPDATVFLAKPFQMSDLRRAISQAHGDDAVAGRAEG
ncbi:hypothetical protein DRQ50_08530 [bacterium]|nr:MAG: hypothetical protein DRQ50_08530 [bacterium]